MPDFETGVALQKSGISAIPAFSNLRACLVESLP